VQDLILFIGLVFLLLFTALACAVHAFTRNRALTVLALLPAIVGAWMVYESVTWTYWAEECRCEQPAQWRCPGGYGGFRAPLVFMT